MKRILQTIVIALCFLLVLASMVTLLPLLRENHKAVDHPKTTVSEVTTPNPADSETTEPETTEPETPSPVMYKHTVTLFYRPSPYDEYIYTFEVISSSSSEFDSVSDVPDGTYSLIDQYSNALDFTIEDGVVFRHLDDNDWVLSVDEFTDTVTVYDPADLSA